MDDRSPEEIAQRALDERCARALGYQTIWAQTIWAESIFGHALYLWDEGAIRTETGATNCTVLGARWERLRIDGEVRELMVRLCPAFSARLEDAKVLEDEIVRRGLQRAYVGALANDILSLDLDIFPSAVERGSPRAVDMHVALWLCITATPTQRAQAFVKVMGYENETT